MPCWLAVVITCLMLSVVVTVCFVYLVRKG
jgi:hypothetical protein